MPPVIDRHFHDDGSVCATRSPACDQAPCAKLRTPARPPLAPSRRRRPSTPRNGWRATRSPWSFSPTCTSSPRSVDTTPYGSARDAPPYPSSGIRIGGSWIYQANGCWLFLWPSTGQGNFREGWIGTTLTSVAAIGFPEPATRRSRASSGLRGRLGGLWTAGRFWREMCVRGVHGDRSSTAKRCADSSRPFTLTRVTPISRICAGWVTSRVEPAFRPHAV